MGLVALAAEDGQVLGQGVGLLPAHGSVEGTGDLPGVAGGRVEFGAFLPLNAQGRHVLRRHTPQLARPIGERVAVEVVVDRLGDDEHGRTVGELAKKPGLSGLLSLALPMRSVCGGFFSSAKRIVAVSSGLARP